MKAWSKKILYYHQNPEILREKEMHILKDWKPISWEDCARQIVHELEKKCKDWEI